MAEVTVTKRDKRGYQADLAGPAFFIAYFGAAVYFWNQAASGVWPHLWALIKALVWPAILVYNALRSFGV